MIILIITTVICGCSLTGKRIEDSLAGLTAVGDMVIECVFKPNT